MEFNKSDVDKKLNASSNFLINYDLETVLADMQDTNNNNDEPSTSSCERVWNKLYSNNNNNNEPEETLISTLVPQLKNLQLSSRSTASAARLAGYLQTIIPQMKTALVQVATGSRILDIGTLVFLNKSNDKKYVEIGRVSDILGTVSEPVYSLALDEVATAILEVDAKVYYLVDHPDTKYVSVRSERDNRYVVVQNLRV